MHVADDDGPVRALLLADLFVGDHDGGGLLGMRAAADAEMMVRRRQAEVGKEAVRHVDVIVLSGMDQYRHEPVLPLQHVVASRNLADVWPGRGDKRSEEHKSQI